MLDENINQKFRLEKKKKIDEIKNYLIEEMEINERVRSIKTFAEVWIILIICSL